MIHLGETKVFERQIAEPIERFVDRGAAFADFGEQRLDLRAIH
jgi:hypothetical protein